MKKDHLFIRFLDELGHLEHFWENVFCKIFQLKFSSHAASFFTPGLLFPNWFRKPDGDF